MDELMRVQMQKHSITVKTAIERTRIRGIVKNIPKHFVCWQIPLSAELPNVFISAAIMFCSRTKC